MTTRALTLLNRSGDQTIVWTPDRDEAMVDIIRKKMEEGIVFFIIEPRLGGLIAPDKRPLEDADEAKKHRALSIRDEDFAKFCGLDGVEVIKTPAAKAVTVRKSKKPEEVAASESVGVQPMRGG